MKIVLASQSPRRRQLLGQMGLEFTTQSPEIDEAAFQGTHQVCTGVTVCRGDKVLTQVEETQVTFRLLTDQEIRQYVSTGEPMDKAGAYGIQGLGGLLVAGIQGDSHNVVGLPVCRLGRMLLDFGVDCLALAGR